MVNSAPERARVLVAEFTIGGTGMTVCRGTMSNMRVYGGRPRRIWPSGGSSST